VRISALIFVLTLFFSTIGYIFWQQEMQYLLPTPKPKNYKAVLPNESIQFDFSTVREGESKPKLFHFFSPNCPCSRFNLKHFNALRKKYNQDVNFYAVVTDDENAADARDMLDSDITVVIDTNEKLAQACGVYSTPQAAILTENNTLFFRGNYNKARYCTAKESNYVQMALDSLVAKKSPPHFVELATESYGCVLDEHPESVVL
jgi:hypothetical protein